MKQSDITNMSASEKLQTMEFLWSSLLEEKTELASPQWHEQLLATRIAKINNGDAKFISLEKLKNFRAS
jgi:hypothetical protein